MFTLGERAWLMANVFIGMPVYDGDRFLEQAIESIISQTYKKWTMLISDNASSDRTEAICREYVEMDSRIQYIRQYENIGAAANFQHLLESADTEFFMWAASDDVWDHEFIETGVKGLQADPEKQAWFCTVDNIDTYNQVVRTYAGFTRFNKSSHYKSTVAYLREPEGMGKANLIYSLYRTYSVQKTAKRYFLSDNWCSDVCFNFAFLSENGYFLSDDVLMHKRVTRPSDRKGRIDEIVLKPKHYISKRHFINYLCESIRAAYTLRDKLAVVYVLGARFKWFNWIRH